MLIVSLEKWSLTFKIIPGIPPRLVLILLYVEYNAIIIKLWLLIYQVHPINHTYVGICMQYIPRITKTNIWLHSVLNWTVDISVCRRFWSVDILVYRRFALSTFRFVNILVCRRFGVSVFQHVDVSVCRHFAGLSTFRFVDVVTSYLQQGPLKHIKAWLITKMVIILQTTYPNGFLQRFFL